VAVAGLDWFRRFGRKKKTGFKAPRRKPQTARWFRMAEKGAAAAVEGIPLAAALLLHSIGRQSGEGG